MATSGPRTCPTTILVPPTSSPPYSQVLRCSWQNALSAKSQPVPKQKNPQGPATFVPGRPRVRRRHSCRPQRLHAKEVHNKRQHLSPRSLSLVCPLTNSPQPLHFGAVSPSPSLAPNQATNRLKQSTNRKKANHSKLLLPSIRLSISLSALRVT